MDIVREILEDGGSGWDKEFLQQYMEISEGKLDQDEEDKEQDTVAKEETSLSRFSLTDDEMRTCPA